MTPNNMDYDRTLAVRAQYNGEKYTCSALYDHVFGLKKEVELNPKLKERMEIIEKTLDERVLEKGVGSQEGFNHGSDIIHDLVGVFFDYRGIVGFGEQPKNTLKEEFPLTYVDQNIKQKNNLTYVPLSLRLLTSIKLSMPYGKKN